MYEFIHVHSGGVVLLAELRLMQAAEVATSSAWGRETGCRGGTTRAYKETSRANRYMPMSWFHMDAHRSKLIKSYTLNMCSASHFFFFLQKSVLKG